MKTNEMKSGNARRMYEQPEINVVTVEIEGRILQDSQGMTETDGEPEGLD